MTAQRLLYLNTHRLSAYAWRQGKLYPEGVFESDDEGLGRFADYIDEQHNSHFSLLANVAEEGHILETIPYLRGSDRSGVITRKIGQHFLGTPLATAVSLGYEKARRKNEKLLLSALTNPAHFAPWLTRINEAEAPLAGIFTIAQLSGRLLKKLGYGSPRCLLLTVQDHSIRESFLVDGKTLFSRMAPLTDSSIAGIASSLSSEAGKLHQYLVGQRQVGRDELLPVFIMAHPQAIPAIEKSCQNGNALSFVVIDNHAAAKQIGLQTPPNDSRSELIFLHRLITAPPRQQFAGAAYRHDFQLSKIRQGLLASGLLALLASGLFSAREIHHTATLQKETQELAARETDLGRRYGEISATFPQLGIDNDTLRRLTTRYSELTQQQRQPGPAYRAVSNALNEMPNIRLEGIEWKIGHFSPSTAASTKPTSGATEINGDEEITTLQGSIRPQQNTTTRQTLTTFNAFIDELRRDPAHTVSILQQPADMGPGRPLRGGNNEDEGLQPRQFSVEITRKLAP